MAGAKTKAQTKVAKPAAAALPATMDADTAKRVTELKAEGNQCFARGDITKALSVYDEAAKLLPASQEKADVLSNRAACFLSQKRYKEAVKECTSALEIAPGFLKALQRRAKAHEHAGSIKEALVDVQAIVGSGGGSEEMKEALKRLQRMGGSSSSSGASNGAPSLVQAATRMRAASNPQAAAQTLASQQFQVKLSHGDEVKMVYVTLGTTYGELMSSARDKFPTAGPFVLKYLDRDGDLVTMTSQMDIQMGLYSIVEQYQRAVTASQQAGAGPKLTPSVQPLRLHAMSVASEADVPKPPPQEDPAWVAVQQRLAAAGEKQAAEEVQVEDWMIDFARVFSSLTSLDPNRHLESHNLGYDQLSKGVDAAVQSEEAPALFAKAADNFRDATCAGLVSWGQVHSVLGQRLLDKALRAGQSVSQVEAAVLKEWDGAEKRYKEALDYNQDYFDGVCALAQLEFERCKLKAGFVYPAEVPKTEGEGADEAAAAAAAAAAATASSEAAQEALLVMQRACLDKLEGGKVKSSSPWLDRALQWMDKAVLLAPSMDARREDQVAGGYVAAPKSDGTQEYSFKQQALIQKGNFLFEWSQMQAAVGVEWRAVLDGATQLFRDAACSEKDIRGALKSHYRIAELGLGPEPEAVAASAPETAAAAAEAKTVPAAGEAAAVAKKAPVQPDQAKGLPSLEVKKRKADKGCAVGA